MRDRIAVVMDIKRTMLRFGTATERVLSLHPHPFEATPVIDRVLLENCEWAAETSSQLGRLVRELVDIDVEITAQKMGTWIPLSNEWLIDHGLMEAPALTPEEERRIDSFKRRWAIAYAVAAPLGWLGRGAEWLHVEALNALFRILRLNASVSHDEEEDDQW